MQWRVKIQTDYNSNQKCYQELYSDQRNQDRESLPTFDIEYLFLNIRGKSVGEEIEVNLVCPDDNETTVPVKST